MVDVETDSVRFKTPNERHAYADAFILHSQVRSIILADSECLVTSSEALSLHRGLRHLTSQQSQR